MARRAKARRIYHRMRRHVHHKKHFPIVGAGVVLAPAFGVIARNGGIGGTIANLLSGGGSQTGANVVADFVSSYTGFDPNSGTFNPTKLTTFALPVIVYVLLKKVAGRQINRIFNRVGVGF